MMEIQSFYEQLVTSSITRAEKKNSEMVALSQTWKLATQQPPSAQITRQTPLQRKTSLATPIRMVLRARYYDPSTAEFISPDPMEYVDGMSLFRGYFSLIGIDPTGLSLHHWIPQALFALFGKLCGKEIGGMDTREGGKVTPEMISDAFVTQTDFAGLGGWGKGSLHECIENGSCIGNYRNEVERILKQSKTCCAALVQIGQLMEMVWGDCLEKTVFCDPQPRTMPPLEGPWPRPLPGEKPWDKPKKPLFGTNKYFDAVVGAACGRNPRPRHPFNAAGDILNQTIPEFIEGAIDPGVHVPSGPAGPTIGPRNGPITGVRPIFGDVVQQSIDMAAEISPRTCTGTGSGTGRGGGGFKPPVYTPSPKPRLQRGAVRCCR